MSDSVAIKYYPLGDSGIVVDFGNSISIAINSLIRSICASIDSLCQYEILEYVPAFTTLTIYYDPLKTSYSLLQQKIVEVVNSSSLTVLHTPVEKLIPVWYNGPDLEVVSQKTGYTVPEIIEMHTRPLYTVFMIGFVPGFPYLGGMDERLATPRKEIPRLRIAAGSVGIAGGQTGIYPLETPGGWQIIGQTPIKIFDISRESPFFLSAGDVLRFVPIEEEDFLTFNKNEYGDSDC